MKNLTNIKRRARRTRVRLADTMNRPRLSVFRSGRFIYAQIIDDASGRTLASATDAVGSKLRSSPPTGGGKRPEDVGFTKVARAFVVGERLAKAALAKQIKQVAFDRGAYWYAGRVKALAEGARAGGLEF